MFFLLYFRQRQRDAKAGAPLRAVGGGDLPAMGIYYGTAHRQADAHIAVVAAGLLRAGAHPIKNTFQAVAIQPHAVILHPELRLVIPAAGCQGDVLYSTPVQGGVFQQIQQYLLHQGGIHRDQQQFIGDGHLHGKIGVPPAELGRRAITSSTASG